MRILKTFKETSSDGPGLRYSIYVAGCIHKCKGCHNPESWNFDQGELLDDKLIDKFKSEIISNPLIDGITISGGDPLCSPDGLLYLLEELSEQDKNIWVYTGYTIEDILDSCDQDMIDSLKYIDILVDGEYKEDLRDTSRFAGSKNQRYIKAKEEVNNFKAIV
jgi:anaerobic ribonucleoside-triphosphate reductase activating protein